MLNPSMGIRSILSLCSAKNYTFSANSKLSFSTGYTTSIGDMMTLLTEPMQVDYDHVRRQLTADQYKHMSLFNASAQYKWKRLVLRLELDNLLNQRHYAYTIFNGINTYTYDYGLCGRTAMLRATFKHRTAMLRDFIAIDFETANHQLHTVAAASVYGLQNQILAIIF